MFSQDTWVLIVKYTASVVSGVYGIYATLNDFHVEKDGKKVLSRTGHLGIALLIFSTLLAISSDIFKDSKEKTQAKKDDEKREQLLKGEQQIASELRDQVKISHGMSTQLDASGEALQKQVNKTSAVLRTARRATMPIPENLLISVAFDIPSTQASIRDYVHRLDSSPPTYPNKGPDIWQFPPTDKELVPNSSGAPGEQELNSFLFSSYFDPQIVDSIPSHWEENMTKVNLDLSADCSSDELKSESHPPGTVFRPGFAEFHYAPRSNALEISCWNLESVREKHAAEFASLLDFAGKYLVVRTKRWERSASGQRVAGHFFKSPLNMRLAWLSLEASMSTRLKISKFKSKLIHVRYANGDIRQEQVYIARIPESARWE